MDSKLIQLLRIKIGAIVTIMIVGLVLLNSCSSDQKKMEADVIDSVQETDASENLDSESEMSSVGLPYHLDQCETYSETFTHPMTGEELKKEVVGLHAEGYCEYIEEMPNGGLMQCKYSEETRIVMASYYKDIDRFSSFGSVKITYKLDGKTVENPLDEVMKNGDCKVSGY